MNFAIGFALASEIVGLVVASVYLGQLIDRQQNWDGFAVIGLLALSLLGWLLHLIYWVRRRSRN